MHPLKQYLSDVNESIQDFGTRVGASRQTLYRIIHGQQAPKPALARRIVEATGGDVTFEVLYPGSGANNGEVIDLAGENSADAPDHERLRLALAIVVNHLTPQDAASVPDDTVAIAAEAVANTYMALSSVTTRQGPDRLCQALRPVLEEILRENLETIAPAALDQGASLATQLYFQMWNDPLNSSAPPLR